MYAKDITIKFYKNKRKLSLVRPNPKQSAVTINWLKRDNVTKYLGADFSKITLNDEVDHIKKMITDEDCYSWMIELDGIIVGNIEINCINKMTNKYKVRTGSLCTIIGEPKNWGAGLGSCSKQAACNWAFNEGGFDLIEAKSYIQNERSWRALEKLGYSFQGIEKGEVAGQNVSWKVYTLKKSDWSMLH